MWQQARRVRDHARSFLLRRGRSDKEKVCGIEDENTMSVEEELTRTRRRVNEMDKVQVGNNSGRRQRRQTIVTMP